MSKRRRWTTDEYLDQLVLAIGWPNNKAMAHPSTESNPLSSSPTQPKPKGKSNRASANAKVLQELKLRHARQRGITIDPNTDPTLDDIQVPIFKIDDPAYCHHKISCFPYQGDSSDQTLKNLINRVVQDGLVITAARPAWRMVAFDMEWTTNYRARKPRPTSLIQIGGQSSTLIIQLAHIRRPAWYNLVLPLPLAEFLRDPTIIKFGVGVTGDADKLLNDCFKDPWGVRVYLNGFLEIMDVAKSVDPIAREELPPKAISLQRLVARYLDQFLPKTKNLIVSNWEASRLSKAQINYAAADVVSAMRVYLKLYVKPAHHPKFLPPVRYADPANF